MNPARSLGPALVAGELHDLWIYLVAPPLDAAVGALAYQLVRGENRELHFASMGREMQSSTSPEVG